MSAPGEFVEAFAAAVPFALREMAGAEAVVRDSGPTTAPGDVANLTAVIRLTTAGGAGRLTLGFPERTATNLARLVLADKVGDLTAELVRDCMGEVANVIAGQAKALLVGTPSHFTLSTPEVRAGGPADGFVGWSIRFESDCGPFVVLLYPPT